MSFEIRKDQQETIEKMKERETEFRIVYNSKDYYTNVGILSSDIGSGKTCTVLMFLKQNKRLEDAYNDKIPYSSICYETFLSLPRDITNLIAEFVTEPEGNKILTYPFPSTEKKKKYRRRRERSERKEIVGKEKIKRVRTNLIVVPHSLVMQWKKEIKTKFPGLFVKIITSKRNLQDFTMEDVYNGYLDQFDAVLCSSTQLQRLYHCTYKYYTFYSNYDSYLVWDRVFIDEADIIATTCPKMPMLYSNFVWLITTTYKRFMQSSSKNWWTRYFGYNTDVIRNEPLLERFVVKVETKLQLSKVEFEKNVLPDNFYYCFLKVLGNKKVNECLNNDDYRSARSLLYDYSNIWTGEDLINICTFANKKCFRKRWDVYHTNIIFACVMQNVTVIKTLLKRLDCWIHSVRRISIVKEGINQIKSRCRKLQLIKETLCHNNICLLCLKVKKKVTIQSSNLICGKCCKNNEFIYVTFEKILEECNYKLKCISLFYSIKCNTIEPININKSLLVIENLDIEDYRKIKYLSSYISQKPTTSFLIFTNNNHIQRCINDEFNKRNMVFSDIKGNHNIINSRVRRFENKQIQTLLLNAQFFGYGLNLPTTDEIVILNALDFETEKQVIGRANRYGRAKPLKVIYICYKNQCEYVLDKIEKHKKDIESRTIETKPTQ